MNKKISNQDQLDNFIQRRRWLTQASGLGLAFFAVPSQAQFRVEVTGLGMAQLPIALPVFRAEEAVPHKISAIIRADLERSGMFRTVDAAGLSVDAYSSLDQQIWRQRGADFMVAGSIEPRANGSFDVSFRLWDAVRAQDLGGQTYGVARESMRTAAHRIADFIYEKLIGEKGVFATRITFVTRSASRHSLWVADADGGNATELLVSPNSAEPIISPAWSPSGSQLAYVSFESRKPDIYVWDMQTRRASLMASFRGSNSAPAWSADGRSIVATLSRDGGSQIYAIDAVLRGEPKRLTQSNSIDTEPVCSADGRWIYFVSDRGGSPQIYRMGPAGGSAEWISTGQRYSISPAISPDGRYLAFIARIDGAFKLHLMDLTSKAVRPLTDTAADESPSFSPNGRLILYATQNQGRSVLMTTTLDGRKDVLMGQNGSVRDPQWGPFAA